MERIQQALIKNKKIQLIIVIIVIVFSAIGMLFSLVFVGMRLNLFNVKGTIDKRNEFYLNSKESNVSMKDSNQKKIELIQAELRDKMRSVRKENFPDISFSWINTEEWKTVSYGLTKDREVIRRAAHDADINPRILVSVVIAEQIRFFTSNRESYKKFFEPLKILGTLSQFSLGVSGIKPETAKMIQNNLKDKNSVFYIASKYENLLDYKDKEKMVLPEVSVEDFDVEGSGIYTRLTNDKDHYYSYLYTALFIKQIQSQWKKAGFDIEDRPEILATIFNLGFDKSIPKPNPETAGSVIEIGGEKISFGNLAYQFYYSGELIDIFGF